MEDDSKEEKSGSEVGSCVKGSRMKAGAAADASAVAGVIARDAE